MTAALMRVKNHFINWRAWELNPVVIKELRQAVRSWAVTGMLMLFLVVLFGTAIIMLITQTLEFNTNQRLGADVFHVFVGILAGASLLFIPVYLGIRLALERQENNLDLIYISTLTPGRIIRGKFFCGAYMSVLFFSACMPFMAFTNLLRGVDLPSVFVILVFLFLVVCALNQVAIFFACLPVSKPFKVLLTLVTLALAVPATAMVVAGSVEMMRSGVGAMLSARDFWIAFTTSAGLALAAVVLLYFLSVALVSPVSANRALPLRIYITFIWLLGLILSAAWVWREHDARLMLPWGICAYLLLTLALLVVIGSHDELSLRVRRDVPQSMLKRAVAFLFYNGTAGGLVWVSALLLITYAITTFVQYFGLGGLRTVSRRLDPGELAEFYQCCTATVLYTLAYSLTALLLHRRFMRRRPPKLAAILALLLVGAWALIPNIGLFFFNKLSLKFLEQTQLGNLFNVFIVKDDTDRWLHIWFAFGWFVLMLALNARWFIRCTRGFRPLDREPPPTAPPPLLAQP